MVHPRLGTSAKTPYVRRISRVMKHVERDLESCGCREFDVTLVSEKDASLWGELFTFRLGYHANQWLVINGDACSYPFVWTLPFRNGVPLPAMLEIILRSRADYEATLDPWLTSSGRWFSQPLDRAKSQAMQQLKLPRVAWSHAAGGLRHRVSQGGLIVAPTTERPTNTWAVISGYQGFVFQRPRAATYLRRAACLDRLLQSWETTGMRLRAAG